MAIPDKARDYLFFQNIYVNSFSIFSGGYRVKSTEGCKHKWRPTVKLCN